MANINDKFNESVIKRNFFLGMKFKNLRSDNAIILDSRKCLNFVS